MRFVIKGYCGYEKKFSAMQAGRVKQQLNKLINTGDFGTTTYKDFIILLLFEKFYLPITKTNQEGDTEYLILDLLGNSYNGYRVNKTQYGFAEYLNANFDDINKVRAYDEQEQLEQELAFKLKQQRYQEEEQIARELARKRKEYGRMIDDEGIGYVGTEVETKKNELWAKVYKDSKPQLQFWPFQIIALINHIDDLTARQILVSRLHTTNRASTKLFEWYSGVKLPKTMKARAEYLMSLKSTDLNKLDIPPKQHRLYVNGPVLGVQIRHRDVLFNLYRDPKTEMVLAVTPENTKFDTGQDENGTTVTGFTEMQFLGRGDTFDRALNNAVRQIGYILDIANGG